MNTFESVLICGLPDAKEDIKEKSRKALIHVKSYSVVEVETKYRPGGKTGEQNRV